MKVFRLVGCVLPIVVGEGSCSADTARRMDVGRLLCLGPRRCICVTVGKAAVKSTNSIIGKKVGAFVGRRVGPSAWGWWCGPAPRRGPS